MTRETEQQLNCEVLVAGGGPAGVNSTSEVCLGFKSASNIDWFNGKLDEVVIARRALTASKISQLYFATQ